MYTGDEAMFFNFTRMSTTSFDRLLQRISPIITKHSRRESISAGCRLAVTLRFLATGDSYPTLAYAFRLSVPTVCVIIKETCNAIWQVLSPTYLKCPDRKQFSKIASNFYNQWQLPNCAAILKNVIVSTGYLTNTHMKDIVFVY
ncbi:hypothetical protein PPYR_02143 [Photinus pyralis]|uniref:Transposase Helix-turn-helix domain-containing protein n=1 Tax=Photinus pyralis TaxID=7054 RepID=A0A5N4B6J5_PHOPY|nr:hypothetical protein PPYR_02143 [Photinus pyralis]